MSSSLAVSQALKQTEFNSTADAIRK